MGLSMGLTELLRACERSSGATPAPDDLAAFWEPHVAAAEAPREVALRPAVVRTPCAEYLELGCAATDGAPLVARALVPLGAGPHPSALVLHDLGRPQRGWLHLTRFVAAGYAVVAPERRPWSGEALGQATLAQLVDDALVAACAAATLPRVDGRALVAWGEGLGGGLAVAVSALLPGRVRAAAALNPLPADLRGMWEQGATGPVGEALDRHFRDADPTCARADEWFCALAYADPASLATLLACPYLQGTCLLDQSAPPVAQCALYNRVPGARKRLVTYPRHAHERVNDFEDRLLEFLPGAA